FTLTTTGFTTVTPIFDASTAFGCPGGGACQPIGASPTLARRDSPPTFEALVVTGGADWARSAPTANYALYAVDTSLTTLASPLYPRAMPSVTTRSGSMPLRGYAQPTVSGTDVFVSATSLAVNTQSSILLPVMYPPAGAQSYGAALRYRNV